MPTFVFGSCGGIAMTAISSLAGEVGAPADAIGYTNRAIAAYRADAPDAFTKLRAGDASPKGAQMPDHGSQARSR